MSIKVERMSTRKTSKEDNRNELDDHKESNRLNSKI